MNNFYGYTIVTKTELVLWKWTCMVL